MAPVLKIIAMFIGVMLAQLYLAQLLSLGAVRPDFILVFLIFASARYGRINGILLGFSAGLLQDLTGSLSVLGANALAKSVVGYTVGTLNGTMTVWTPRIVNLYIYGSLLGHAIIYQTIMVQGLQASPGILTSHILLEALMSSAIVTGMRYLIPIMPSRA
ncbi:MAG: rod shape-determining protein MreD [Fidelibacterota bacterium]|nr:MAG: rod shape-determining protein MreD [Candidatus Neomarinimicrobiota bacterium]